MNQNCRELSDLLDAYFFATDADLANAALQKMDVIIKQGRDEFAEKIKVTTDTLGKVTDVLKKTPGLIKDSNKELQNTINLISDTTKEQINYIVQEIKTSLSTELAKVTESFDGSAKAIHGAAADISRVPEDISKLKGKFEKVIKETQDSYDSLNEKWAEAIANAVQNIISNSSDQVQKFVESFKSDIENKTESVFGGLNSKFGESIDKLRNDFESSLHKIEEKSEKMITSSVNGVSEEIKNSLKTLADTHKEQLEFEQKSFEESTEKFKSTIKEMIEQVDAIPSELNELYTELAKIPEEVKTINERLDTSSLNGTIDRIQELSRSMKEGETTLISLMNNSGDSFKEAVGTLRETANEFNSINEKMKEAERKFESSNTAMSVHITNLLEHDRDITQSLKEIADKLGQNTEGSN